MPEVDDARILHARARDFTARPGPRLRLRGERMRVTGFDPLTVHVLPGEQVLHARYLSIEVPGGALEGLGGQALAGGEDLLHPFSLTVADVPEPTVARGRWTLRSKHLRADPPAASLRATPNGWDLCLN
jgi:hypothetical protein